MAPLLIPLVSAAAQPPQGRTTPQERQRMFEQYLVRRAADVTRGNLAGIASAEDWKRKRPEIRGRMLWMLGLNPMPERTPLQPRITGSFERDAYRVEKIVFQSLPGLYVTGNLYLPKPLGGRAPAVLYLCGHSPGPWGAKVQYRHHGIWLARHGRSGGAGRAAGNRFADASAGELPLHFRDPRIREAGALGDALKVWEYTK